MLLIFKGLRESFAFWCLVFLFLGVYGWKMSLIFWIPDISDHLSNFALTGLFSLLLMGPKYFARKKDRRRVWLVTALFVASNLVVELASVGALQGFNVLDLLDALYGIAASAIVLAAHYYVCRQKSMSS